MPQPVLDVPTLAANWGWSMAVLNSNPEIKGLFERAVSGTWDASRFQAEVMNTNWWKTTGEATRRAQQMQAEDPATWAQNVNTTSASIRMATADIGAILDEATSKKLASDALSFGWNDAQLKTALRQYVTYSDGQLHGVAQYNENQIWNYAAQMGIRVTQDQMVKWAADAATGLTSMNTVLGAIQNIAESQYPWLQERFNNGETYESIASPYKQTMATLLELSPSQITTQDETVKRAMSYKDKDGNTNLRSLWEFEQDLRNDGRWAKTQNAQDAGMAIVNGLGKMFGKIS